MEITDAKEILLSNFEVYQLLKESQNAAGGQKKRNDPVATVRYEVLEYLQKTPCASQTEENIKKLLAALKPYNLKKEQFIALINHRPTTVVEISYLLDDISEEKLAEIVKHVVECLPP